MYQRSHPGWLLLRLMWVSPIPIHEGLHSTHVHSFHLHQAPVPNREDGRGLYLCMSSFRIYEQGG
jgi:hypothetical protein